MDGLGAEPEVRDRLRARLLRVVDEVALHVDRRVLADDLDAVLVRADGAVGAEAEEHRPHGARGLGDPGGIVGQAGPAHVVVNADREVIPRRRPVELVEDGLDHRRRQLLGAEAVAAADHARQARQGAGVDGLDEAGEGVQVERLARRPRLLGAVEDGDRPDGGRQHREQVLRRERAEQADLDHADALAAAAQGLCRLARGLDARAHEQHHPLGLRIAVVLERTIDAAADRGEAVHGRGHDPGGVRVEGVDRFA